MDFFKILTVISCHTKAQKVHNGGEYILYNFIYANTCMQWFVYKASMMYYRVRYPDVRGTWIETNQNIQKIQRNNIWEKNLLEQQKIDLLKKADYFEKKLQIQNNCFQLRAFFYCSRYAC